MRIVWKDSSVRQKSSRLYRGIEVVGFENGWKIGLPDDDNVYKTWICCQNAIDKVLGGCGARNASKRKTHIFVRNGASWIKMQ